MLLTNVLIMKKKLKNLVSYAIWIDHKKAIIVNVGPKGAVNEETILSEVESRERFKGETTNKTRLSNTTLDVEKKMQNRDHELIHHFHKKIIELIPLPTVFVLILGPAEAKYELHKTFSKKKSLSHMRIEVKTTGKLKPEAIADLLLERIKK